MNDRVTFIRLVLLFCTDCSARLRVRAARADDARETARFAGWLHEGDVTLCPACQAQQAAREDAA